MSDDAKLKADLQRRRFGTATSVREELWQAAEVYPRPNHAFPLTDDQRKLLALFSHQP